MMHCVLVVVEDSNMQLNELRDQTPLALISNHGKQVKNRCEQNNTCSYE